MENNCNGQNTEMMKQAFDTIKMAGDFTLSPCDTKIDFSDKSKFTQVECDTTQKMRLSAVAQQIPNLLAAGSMAQAYTVKFPKGLPHTLTSLQQSGFGSMIRGADGKFVGTASFYPMQVQAAFLGAFSVMAIASGQFFLTEIFKDLKIINLKLEKILEFLYGDKKAELMAEISFVKYAYQNYRTIMPHETQRSATIVSLQQSKKVAMKDIEFYINDLNTAVNEEAKTYSEIEAISKNAFQIQESLVLSIQLYVMSSLLESYYAQNDAHEYIQYLENEMLFYMDKCEKRILSSFSVLDHRLQECKTKRSKENDKAVYEAKVTELIYSLNSGEESSLRKAVRNTLHASSKSQEYYLDLDGTLYQAV